MHENGWAEMRERQTAVRRALGALVVAAVALLGVVVPGTSSAASAASTESGTGFELGLSRDGVSWSRSLDAPLFDPEVRWVPGDVRTARFYVRNQAASRGAMTVTVRSVRRDALLETRTLTVAARSDGGEWRAVDGPSLVPIVDADLIASGDAVPVDVRVAMDVEAPNRTMVLATDLEFTVQLADARAVADGGSGDGGGSEDGLGSSGASVPAWLVLVGALALFAGTGLLLARRGLEADDDTDEGTVSRPTRGRS